MKMVSIPKRLPSIPTNFSWMCMWTAVSLRLSVHEEKPVYENRMWLLFLFKLSRTKMNSTHTHTHLLSLSFTVSLSHTAESVLFAFCFHRGSMRWKMQKLFRIPLYIEWAPLHLFHSFSSIFSLSVLLLSHSSPVRAYFPLNRSLCVFSFWFGAEFSRLSFNCCMCILHTTRIDIFLICAF